MGKQAGIIVQTAAGRFLQIQITAYFVVGVEVLRREDLVSMSKEGHIHESKPRDIRREHIRKGAVRNIDAKVSDGPLLRDGKAISSGERGVEYQPKWKIGEPGTNQKQRREYQ